MILLEDPDRRERRNDLWLGGTTAAVAGFVNVCSVIAFFAFASNVTGHAAIFAEEVVKGHPHQVAVVIAWLGLFIAGALAPKTGRAAPLVLEVALLLGVGYYGHHHYGETLKETEYLVGVLLFSMGVQNSMVATVSRGLVKTTHLTGLSTDLGMEFSMMLSKVHRRDDRLRFKLKLHLLIFAMYLAGGMAGGALFMRVGFQAFMFATAGLICILVHDIVVARTREPLPELAEKTPEAPKLPKLRN